MCNWLASRRSVRFGLDSFHGARRPILALAMIILGGVQFLLGAARVAARPSHHDKGSGYNAAVETLFDAQQPAIRECALQKGIYQGAKSIDLNAKILVNGTGRVFSAQVTAKTDGGDRKGIETCVAKVLQGMKFPTTASFREIFRNWRFAIQ